MRHETGEGCAIYDRGYRVLANGDHDESVAVEDLREGDTYLDPAMDQDWFDVAEVAEVDDDVHVASSSDT